jgi:hypothetical protein
MRTRLWSAVVVALFVLALGRAGAMLPALPNATRFAIVGDTGTGDTPECEVARPQKGIAYFIEGGSAKLREGDIQNGDLRVVGLDRERSFMVAEVAGDTFHFETISRVGQLVDKGIVENVKEAGTPAR